jgi:hypothetical protein
MNAAAFRKGEAISRLENYAYVIVEHLALVTWFPTPGALSHWNIELAAFSKALLRYDTGKGVKHNFIGVESHGVPLPETVDWEALSARISAFADALVLASGRKG